MLCLVTAMAVVAPIPTGDREHLRSRQFREGTKRTIVGDKLSSVTCRELLQGEGNECCRFEIRSSVIGSKFSMT